MPRLFFKQNTHIDFLSKTLNMHQILDEITIGIKFWGLKYWEWYNKNLSRPDLRTMSTQIIYSDNLFKGTSFLVKLLFSFLRVSLNVNISFKIFTVDR